MDGVIGVFSVRDVRLKYLDPNVSAAPRKFLSDVAEITPVKCVWVDYFAFISPV